MARRRLDADTVRDLSLAWHIEALHRQKKLPALKAMLPQRLRAAEQPQSVKHHLVMLEMIGAKHGIKLRKTRLVKREAKRG